MPAIIETDETLNQTSFIEKPDMRFGTTFLSYQYRDKAVKGESLMDKITGEIFHKRSDNRVVSFFENKRFMYDVCMELKILMASNSKFTYPEELETGFYINTNYDSMTLNHEKRLNILQTNLVIDNDEEEKYTKLKFTSAAGANGFLFKPGTRDSDKAIVEFLTNEYNNLIENYDGNDPNHQLEKTKFNYEGYKESNASLEYTVKVSKDVRVINEDRTVVIDGYENYDPVYMIQLSDARLISPEYQVGDIVYEHYDPATTIRWSNAKQINSTCQVRDTISVSKTYTVGNENSSVFTNVTKTVVSDSYQDFDEATMVRLSDALLIDPEIQVGGSIYYETSYPVGYPVRINDINIVYFPDVISTDFPEKTVSVNVDKIVVEDNTPNFLPASMVKLSVAQASFPAITVGEVIQVRETKKIPGYEKAEVTIKAIRFEKIQYMYNLYNTMTEEWKTLFNNLIALDKVVYIDYYDVRHFINKISDIEFFGNEMIVTLTDIPYLNDFLDRVSNLHAGGSILLSAKRPLRSDWKQNALWGEIVRSIGKGREIYTNSETDIDRMEARFAELTYVGPVNMNVNETDNFLLNPEDDSMEPDDFATMLMTMSRAINNRLENIVEYSDSDGLDAAFNRVNDYGIILETVDTEVRD